MLNRLSRFAWLAVFSAIAAMPATASTISLTWDSVEDPDLAGYRIYYGTSVETLDASLDVGLVSETTLSLAECTNYFLGVKAYSDTGAESTQFSNIVSGWGRPVPAAATPSALSRGATIPVVIEGTNFQAGAVLNIEGAGVTVSSVSVNGCSQIVAQLAVDATAPLGSRSVTVVNPSGVFGSGNATFQVVSDSSGPQISGLAVLETGATTARLGWTTDEAADGRVYYRPAGQTTYQAGAPDYAFVTAHEVVLTGLAPSTSYEFYVVGSDTAGNAAEAATGPNFTTSASANRYLRIEAESGLLGSPIESFGAAGSGAFGNEWIALPAGSATGYHYDPTGEAEYGFHVPADGVWYVWLRMYGVGANGDGWLESVDGAALDYVWPSDTGGWHWAAGRSYTLSAGLHTLRLGGHEAEARIDRILITDDPEFLPTEQVGDDNVAPPIVESFGVTAGDGFNTLSWSTPTAADAERIVIRYRTDGVAPASPHDGMPLVDSAAASGTHEHAGLANGVAYDYSLFVIDAAGNASEPASAQASPQETPPDAVDNLRRNDTM